jgi:hypothetical protein
MTGPIIHGDAEPRSVVTEWLGVTFFVEQSDLRPSGVIRRGSKSGLGEVALGLVDERL